MCKLLMSINPEHVNNILSGAKRFEFRKTRCKEDIDPIIIYSTSPIMKVVAEAEVTGIIEDTPQGVWESTFDAAGINKDFFDSYFAGRSVAIAYALGTVRPFKTPLSLSDFGITSPPQSYIYIRD